MLIKRLEILDLKAELSRLQRLEKVMPLYSRRRRMGLIRQEIKDRRPN